MESKKRKLNDEEVSAEPLYNNKYQSTPANVDPTYGQRSAFPGLDDDYEQGGDGDPDYDEEMDAMVYLRAVRLVLPHPIRESCAGAQLILSES